jgi:hypothetical protein
VVGIVLILLQVVCEHGNTSAHESERGEACLIASFSLALLLSTSCSKLLFFTILSLLFCTTFTLSCSTVFQASDAIPVDSLRVFHSFDFTLLCEPRRALLCIAFTLIFFADINLFLCWCSSSVAFTLLFFASFTLFLCWCSSSLGRNSCHFFFSGLPDPDNLP